MAHDAGVTLDPWQQKVMRWDTTDPDERLILCNASRQSGKSLVAALSGLHSALCHGHFVLVTSPSLRQSHETTKIIFKAYRKLGKPVKATHLTMTELSLENGGRILCLPGKGETIRGHSAVDRLIVEEAALVPDELWAVVSPMTAVSQGRVLMIFTPHGKRGFLWELWRNGEGEQITVPATLCSRIPAPYLEQEMRRLGPYFFAQEFQNQWMEPQTAAFREEDILGAMSEEIFYDSELFKP